MYRLFLFECKSGPKKGARSVSIGLNKDMAVGYLQTGGDEDWQVVMDRPLDQEIGSQTKFTPNDLIRDVIAICGLVGDDGIIALDAIVEIAQLAFSFAQKLPAHVPN